ncbi:MFS transporter [Corynebacterium sp. USCH3]|uniref:MFS transporter n=1 Tax=Corynebacterium sp. USCH3 TaxID=3024840 RepID=UPI0030AF3B2F
MTVLSVRGVPLMLLSVFCAFLGWSLLLPVIPVAMLDAGYGDSLAGLSTGVFMAATVITQIFVPRLLRRWGYVPVMVSGAVLLGVPSALYLIDGGSWLVLVVSAIRGIGFGAVTVAQSALLAELVPVHQLGRANAFFGASIGVGEIIGFTVGLPLYTHAGDLVFLVAVGCGVIGGFGALGIPALQAAEVTRDTAQVRRQTQRRAPLWKLVLVPIVGLCTGAMGFGAFSTFTAPAVGEIDATAAATLAGVTLAVIGGGQILGRTISGWWADRVGEPGRLVVWASLSAVGGMLAMSTLIVTAPTGGVLVVGALGAAAVFGLGFGAIQSETLLMMFSRMPKERVSEASAMWNIGFDSGTGAGSSVLGVAATTSGYGGAFLVGAGLVGLGTATLAGDRILGRNRVAEHGNVRARLRSLRPGGER